MPCAPNFRWSFVEGRVSQLPHGAEALVAAIENNIGVARGLASAITASDDFELLAPVPLSIVCFRYVPAHLRGREPELNAFNRELMVAVQRDGSSYMSNATIGATFALRVCIVNHRTVPSDIEQLLGNIRLAARRLLA